MKNQTVTNATGSQFDKRVMAISNILEHDVNFASMVIGYKIIAPIGKILSSKKISMLYMRCFEKTRNMIYVNCSGVS